MTSHKLDADTGLGSRIIRGLEEAVRGDFAAVTVEGQHWVRGFQGMVEKLHQSDCAVHNEPAVEAGERNYGIVRVIGWEDFEDQKVFRAVVDYPHGELGLTMGTVWDRTPVQIIEVAEISRLTSHLERAKEALRQVQADLGGFHEDDAVCNFHHDFKGEVECFACRQQEYIGAVLNELEGKAE